MTDIVERLRLLAKEVEPDFGGTLDEAADTIDELVVALESRGEMTDIVEELENTWVGSGSGTILHDAKIEILRLRKDNKKIKLLEKELNKYIAAFDEAEAKIDELMVDNGKLGMENNRLKYGPEHFGGKLMQEMRQALVGRITEYLQAGGLFNPELMDQCMVQELLIDCRAALDNKTQQSQYEKTKTPANREKS